MVCMTRWVLKSPTRAWRSWQHHPGQDARERPERLLHRHHPPDQGFAWGREWQPEILDLCLIWTTVYPCWTEMEEVLHPSGESDLGLPPVPLTGQESPGGQGLQNNFLSLFSIIWDKARTTVSRRRRVKGTLNSAGSWAPTIQSSCSSSMQIKSCKHRSREVGPVNWAHGWGLIVPLF